MSKSGRGRAALISPSFRLIADSIKDRSRFLEIAKATTLEYSSGAVPIVDQIVTDTVLLEAVSALREEWSDFPAAQVPPETRLRFQVSGESWLGLATALTLQPENFTAIVLSAVPEEDFFDSIIRGRQILYPVLVVAGMMSVLKQLPWSAIGKKLRDSCSCCECCKTCCHHEEFVSKPTNKISSLPINVQQKNEAGE